MPRQPAVLLTDQSSTEIPLDSQCPRALHPVVYRDTNRRLPPSGACAARTQSQLSNEPRPPHHFGPAHLITPSIRPVHGRNSNFAVTLYYVLSSSLRDFQFFTTASISARTCHRALYWSSSVPSRIINYAPRTYRPSSKVMEPAAHAHAIASSKCRLTFTPI